MQDSNYWQLLVAEDEVVVSTIIDVFTQMYHTHFINELLVNHQLPVEIRAFRHNDIWRVFLLLTPWMLARIFMPMEQPEKMGIPAGWLAQERVDAPLSVIGPAIALSILGGREKAHLNYHPNLGHYLIQPLVQSMEQFKASDEVFNAWNDVIRTRQRVIEEQKKKCEWQEDVCRREFFAKLMRRAAAR